MAGSMLPLFALHTVLYPGAELRLRIFETRYLDMIRRCLKSGDEFGVVGIREGSEVGDADAFAVGTSAAVVDWGARPDGLLGISVEGRRRFRVLESDRAPDGLYSARVDWLAPDEPTPLDARHAWAARLLQDLVGPEGRPDPELAERLEDANRVCWKLAEILPLGIEDKQTLLEIESPAERLDQLRLKAAEIVAARPGGDDGSKP